jgi:hypothetical protein
MEPARQPAAAIDVDQLAAQVTQLASSQQLVVVPATPLPKSCLGHLVLLNNNDLSATDFCQLASAAGARLLYVQAEGFDAGTDPDLDVEAHDHSEPHGAAGAQLAELRRDAERFNGRIRQLELAFAVGCVLHCWAVAADWYDSLVDRAAELCPCDDLEAERLADAGA